MGAYFCQMDAMSLRKATDWDAIRAAYEQGDLSNRALARRYAPLTEGAVRKRAKTEGWIRPKGARIARSASVVRHPERPLREHWQDREPAARRIIVGRRDSVKFSRRSPEDAVDIGEIVLAEFLDIYKIIVENREFLLEILENCIEDHRVPRSVYLKMRKQFNIPDQIRQFRSLVETLKVFASTRQILAGLASQKGL